MWKRLGSFAILSFCSLIIAGATGCASSSQPKLACRTAEQKQELIRPGLFGKNAAADRRRRHFDFWNEQIIQQDVAVGTVFIGDSITEFWELAGYFVPSDGVILNRGIGGDIASHMAKRFEADVIQLRPRNVVILAGTNDVTRMLGQKKSVDEIVCAVSASVESMIDAALAAGINTLVCSILPTNDDYRIHTGKKPILPRINQKLKAACAAKGCIYVDYWAKVSDANGDLLKNLARDGLHPHYAGYEIMAESLRAAARANGLRL